MSSPAFAILLLLCFQNVFSETTTSSSNISDTLKEMEYVEGISVDPKYVLPTVNASTFSDDGNLSNIKVQSVPASLSRVLDFYNTELLAANWNRVQKGLSSKCKEDVQKYVDGLVTGDKWALKMDDASGRYSTGWFWGNHYWTGSQSLCENIVPTDKDILLYSNSNGAPNLSNSSHSTTVSPSQSMGYQSGRLVYTSTPPFDIAFYMVRVNLNSSFTTEERVINVGLCLPWSCTHDDVTIIMEKTSKASPRISLHVEAVRSQHQRFDIWQDTTFRILCGVTLWVVFLLIAGTVYDFHVQRLKERRKSNTVNCTTYTNSGMTLGDKSIKLDMTVADMKIYNGKSGFYMVNNNNVETTNDDDNNNANGNNPQLPSEVSKLQEESEQKMKFNKEFIVCLLSRLLLAFSVRTNMRNICDQTVGSDTIPVIHGLKSISMAWVILGHTCIVAFKYSDNMEYRKVVQREFIFQTITNGTFSVDTFFFTSGLLVSFLYFRTNAKGKLDNPIVKKMNAFSSGLLHFIGLIIYRFFRLTAPYLFVLGIVEVSMKWFNYNSVFEPPTTDHINCPDYWWRNVLYINTLFPVEQMCMLWSWYLSDDTQFYIIGAILLILAKSHFKSSVSLLLLFMISSWLTTGYIAFSNSHMPGADDPLALFDKIYDKPWTRLGPYLIGMSVGWLLFKTNCHIAMSKLTVAVGWLLSSACLLSLIYGLYEVNLSPIAGALYSSLSHTAWALGLAWVVVACTTGHGGYVNSILSATILYPFSRVTYCAYLIHPIAIRIMAMSMDQPIHLGKGIMIIIFLGQVVASYVLSFMISIAFEGPPVSMLRILTRLSPKSSITKK